MGMETSKQLIYLMCLTDDKCSVGKQNREGTLKIAILNRVVNERVNITLFLQNIFLKKHVGASHIDHFIKKAISIQQ